MIQDPTSSDSYLKKVRNGTLPQGLEIGCHLDTHLRFKSSNFNVIVGHANVGKTDWIVWYMVCLSVKHSLSWLIFSSENNTGSLKRKIIEYKTNQKLEDLSEEQFNQANQWVNFKFHFVDTNQLYSGYDLLNLFEQEKERFDGAIIDPYNSLKKDSTLGLNSHDYDYQFASEIRLFCKRFNKSVYIIAHGVTEALRKTHRQGHEFEGHTIPLNAADIEGGGKWVNRADDFIVLHRYTQDENHWMTTQVHVRKIKETETGGKPTYIDDPVRCIKNKESFFVNSVNPIGQDYKPKEIEPNKEFFESDWMKIDEDETPF